MRLTVYVVVEVHNDGDFEAVYGVYTSLEDAERGCALVGKNYDYPSELIIYPMEVE